MKETILKYWWAQVVMLSVFEILSICVELTSCVFWADLVFVLCAVTFLTIMISWVYLLRNRKWWQCIVSFLTSTIISAVYLLALGFTIMFYPHNDEFGKKHPIPEGLEYSIPSDYGKIAVAHADSLDTDSYLRIWNDHQGGMYKYDFYYGALPAGDIYLKCFEVTENKPLSADSILQATMVSIENSSTFAQIVSKQPFTIFEGDWGEYYAARIEVWHKDAATRQEQKLYEKIYRVEGWMR